MKSGPDLSTHLTSLGITCVSTVPTLLSTIPALQLPTVRLLIVGGEACSRELANRWSSRAAFFNTYGVYGPLPVRYTLYTVCDIYILQGGVLTAHRSHCCDHRVPVRAEHSSGEASNHRHSIAKLQGLCVRTRGCHAAGTAGRRG